MTEEEQGELLMQVKPFDLQSAIDIAKQIIAATGDLPQGYAYTLAMPQANLNKALEALQALRPEGAVPYDFSDYV